MRRVVAVSLLFSMCVPAVWADDAKQEACPDKVQVSPQNAKALKWAAQLVGRLLEGSGRKARPAVAPAVVTDQAFEEQEPPIELAATHKQIAIIQLQGKDDQQLPSLNAFALDADGHLLTACGEGPGLIGVADADGKLVRSWDIEVKPESITAADDGTILVGGDGRLFRFSSEGELLHEAESPHVASLRGAKEQLQEQAKKMLLQQHSQPSRVEMYEMMIAQLEQKAEKGELNRNEKRALVQLPKMLEREKKKQAAKAEQEGGKPQAYEPSEEEVAELVEQLLNNKLRISSVSSTGDHVFVATGSREGWGFDAWKMNHDFTGAEVIVTGLRGCCGQMDVQCCNNEVFVAENGRHRVVKYDLAGEKLESWGGRDRSGTEGFTSCCNPMNVCFSRDGDVFTAESNTGHIKRFSPEGELVSYAGKVDLVPGCKNVSIAVSPDETRIYMLDLTRNHIVVMELLAEETQKVADAAS